MEATREQILLMWEVLGFAVGCLLSLIIVVLVLKWLLR